MRVSKVAVAKNLANDISGGSIPEPFRLPDEHGHFGIYGGRFVAETLMKPLEEIE
jgi:hypothetical protein